MMMRLNKRVFVIALSFLMYGSSLDAAVGEITINGEAVPDVIFKGFSIRMSPENRCSPISDNYVRDSVIKVAIVAMEGKNRNYEISKHNQKWIDNYTKELEFLGPTGDVDEIANFEYLRYSQLYSAYIGNFPAMPTHAAILAEYKRLIKTKDPRFTDKVLIKHTPLEFYSVEDTLAAKKMLERGRSIQDVKDKYDDVIISTTANLYWYLIEKVDESYKGDGREIQPMSVVQLGDMKLTYISGVKFRSRLRPFTDYQGNENYVYKEIKWELQRAMQKERAKRMWEAADVREDGIPISLSESYASCP